MGKWLIDQIRENERKKLEEQFKDASKEEILERLIDICTVFHPILYVLSSTLDGPGSSKFSIRVDSKFFIEDFETEMYQVYNSEKKEFDSIENIPENELHKVNYELRDSLTIRDGTQLNDDFSVLRVHQEEIACYISCGEITAGDIRLAEKVVWGKEKIIK